MIQVGDKVKGFRFYDEVDWFEPMSHYIGVEGTVVKIFNQIDDGRPYYFEVKFNSLIYENVEYWCYPIKEYVAIQREEKLKELGI